MWRSGLCIQGHFPVFQGHLWCQNPAVHRVCGSHPKLSATLLLFVRFHHFLSYNKRKNHVVWWRNDLTLLNLGMNLSSVWTADQKWVQNNGRQHRSCPMRKGWRQIIRIRVTGGVIERHRWRHQTTNMSNSEFIEDGALKGSFPSRDVLLLSLKVSRTTKNNK